MNSDTVQLLISMIVAYDDWGDRIGYTKDELDSLIEKYDLINKGEWNELGSIILYNFGYITREQFCKDMDLIYDDGDFWMSFDDFEDLVPLETEAMILDGRIWEIWEPHHYYEYDIDFSDFDEKTLEAIIEVCINNGFSIDNNEDMSEEIVATKENTKIVDGKIYIGGEELRDHIGDDGMNELKRSIQFGYSDAYESAEQDAAYKECVRKFEEGIGEYKWVTVKEKNSDDSYERLRVKATDLIDRAKEELEDYYKYNGKITYSTDDYVYGNLYYVLREFEIIKMEKVDFQYLYFYPNRDLIDECVRERVLSDL